jgi:Tol biopolymer transport system component
VEYAPPGYLLYVRESTLVAHPFDAKSGELTGDPMPLAQDLGVDNLGLAHFSASRNGVLVFRGGEAGGGLYQWVDRSGQPDDGPLMDVADVAAFDLSPDGRWLAFEQRGREGADIWVRDLTRGTSSRFTFADGDDAVPLWSPDGTRIAFATSRGGPPRLAIKPVGGAGEVELLFEADGGPQFPSSWSPDGRHLLFMEVTPEGPIATGIVDLEGEAEPRYLLRSPFFEFRAGFSPDGHWIAYQSNESGRSEVYVRPFEGQGRKWQISTAGGAEPQWSSRGDELFYLSPEMRLMRVEVSTRGEFEAGIPEPLFTANLRPIRTLFRYRASRDGQRFLLLSSLSEDSTPPTTVVLNWTQELAER